MANFGETLRRERELRDISLREIADATKVNLRYLEALEQNRFDILPGGVFNKGFIRAYARFIGADGESLVDRYLQEMAEREAREQQASGATSLSPGLHRPVESPRRRAGADNASPAETATQSAADAPTIALAETAPRPAPPAAHQAPPAPRPALPAPALQHSPTFESVAGATDARIRERLIATVLWIAGAVAIAFLGLWVVRGLRPAAPAPSGDATPSTAATELAGDTGAAALPGALPGPAAASDDASAGNGAIGEAAFTAGGANPASPAVASSSPPSAVTVPPAGDQRTGSAAGASPAPGTRATIREPEPTRRDDSIERFLSSGSTPRQPATPRPPAAPQQAPAPPPMTIAASGSPRAPGVESRPPAGAPAAPAQGAMDFRLEATAPVWAQVACDGDQRLNQALQAGQGVSMRCLSFVRLSVTDIGAVRLTVNGGRCTPPGDRGARIQGFVIRAEDAAAICPIQRGDLRGSR
jgi:transcriptional regulator with XRE-family HTH domain